MTWVADTLHVARNPSYVVVRGIVAGFFVLAALSKLIALDDFAHAISDYGIVYEGMELPTAVTFGVAELLGGIGLWFEWRGSLTLLSLLLLLFTGVLIYGISIGLAIDCGCLGLGFEQGLEIGIARNVVLGLACAFLAWQRHVEKHR